MKTARCKLPQLNAAVASLVAEQKKLVTLRPTTCPLGTVTLEVRRLSAQVIGCNQTSWPAGPYGPLLMPGSFCPQRPRKFSHAKSEFAGTGVSGSTTTCGCRRVVLSRVSSQPKIAVPPLPR